MAQWVAVDHADRLGALVLGATTAGDRHGPERDPAVTADLLSGDAERLEPLFYAPDVDPREDRSGAVFTAAGDRRTLRLFHRASRGHDTLDHLASITAPTLVQHGADDRVTSPEHARLLARSIAGARLELFAGLRHGYYLQSPTALAQITEHLAAHRVGDPDA